VSDGGGEPDVGGSPEVGGGEPDVGGSPEVGGGEPDVGGSPEVGVVVELSQSTVRHIQYTLSQLQHLSKPSASGSPSEWFPISGLFSHVVGVWESLPELLLESLLELLLESLLELESDKLLNDELPHELSHELSHSDFSSNSSACQVPSLKA
jgi:hypothetical protein